MTRTTDQLRHAIDKEGAADKVSAADPAAAPLGADDEAAGHPPRPSEILRSFGAEIAGAPARPRRGSAGMAVGVFVILVVLAAVASTALLLR
jgi:hypothetical protein